MGKSRAPVALAATIACTGAVTFISLSVFVLIFSSLACAAERFTDAGQVRQWAYESILDNADGAKITSGSGVGQSYVGKPDSYRGKAGAKAIAVCIDWSRSTNKSIWYGGSSRVWQDHSGPRMQRIRQQAEDNCAKYQTKGCRCQLVDENGKNVLQVPDEFIQKMLAK